MNIQSSCKCALSGGYVKSDVILDVNTSSTTHSASPGHCTNTYTSTHAQTHSIHLIHLDLINRDLPMNGSVVHIASTDHVHRTQPRLDLNTVEWRRTRDAYKLGQTPKAPHKIQSLVIRAPSTQYASESFGFIYIWSQVHFMDHYRSAILYDLVLGAYTTLSPVVVRWTSQLMGGWEGFCEPSGTGEVVKRLWARAGCLSSSARAERAPAFAAPVSPVSPTQNTELTSAVYWVECDDHTNSYVFLSFRRHGLSVPVLRGQNDDDDDGM